MRPASRLGRFLFLALFGAGLAGVVRCQAITEFPLPSSGAGVGAITAGPDGNLWFVENAANAIGRISPSGVVAEFPIPTAGSGPASIAAGSDGNLWFTESQGNKIGRISASGLITEFPAAGSGLGDIVSGPDGNLWFASGGRIWRITTAGVVAEVGNVPSPVGITLGPDGNLWFTLFFGGEIGRITPTGTVTQFSPAADGAPWGITAGPDGNLWFTDDGANSIGRMTPLGELNGNFALPTDKSFPNGIAPGPDGNLWFTEGASNRIGRITPTGDITEFFVPSAGSSPSGITAGPDGNIWFTESAGNRIGRLTLGLAGPCVGDSRTLCLRDGRFRVQADWQTQASTGHATAVPLLGGTGAFWFFDPQSFEAVIKVLDGCSLNGHSWVFAGGLTNVGVILIVTDTATGATREYANPDGTPFQPVQDTTAFASCP
jgi:streptogramin lyase